MVLGFRTGQRLAIRPDFAAVSGEEGNDVARPERGIPRDDRALVAGCVADEVGLAYPPILGGDLHYADRFTRGEDHAQGYDLFVAVGDVQDGGVSWGTGGIDLGIERVVRSAHQTAAVQPGHASARLFRPIGGDGVDNEGSECLGPNYELRQCLKVRHGCRVRNAGASFGFQERSAGRGVTGDDERLVGYDRADAPIEFGWPNG